MILALDMVYLYLKKYNCNQNIQCNEFTSFKQKHIVYVRNVFTVGYIADVLYNIKLSKRHACHCLTHNK